MAAHRKVFSAGRSLLAFDAEQCDRSYGQMTQLVSRYGIAMEEADIVITL